MESEKRSRNLKRLGFAEKIAINAVIYVSNLYVYAKQSSGVVRSTGEAVERAVEPVYGNLNSLSANLLFILDDKVDKGLNKVNEHAPFAKWAIGNAQLMTQKTSLVARNFVHIAQTNGPSAAIRYSGQLFTQLLLIVLVNFWYAINQITALHVMAQMAIPIITQWSEMYNNTISEKADEGYFVFRYLPLVPTEEIIKAYKQVEAERGPVCTLCNCKED